MCAVDMKHSLARNALIAITLLSACGCKPKESEIGWARAALERNPQVEVLAADPNTRVLTIRIKTTGTIRTIKPDELAAAPQDLLGPSVQTAPAQLEVPPAAPPPESSTAIASPDESAPPAPIQAPLPQPQSAATYKIAREAGQVRISGPGVSIVSVPAAKGEAPISTPPSDPIVCDGRFMHLDGRSINVSGDAVIARNGCELHITNSRITAVAGSGITIQNATVHIDNTQVKGTDASVDAGDGAKLYVRGSIFNGVLRRSDKAQINEIGSNQWR